MLQKIALFITVIDVIRDMGIETSNGLDWVVGSKMAHWYERHTKCAPVKDNRKKTNSGGSHCFALYHESYRERIESFVRATLFEAARQPELFSREASKAINGQGVDVKLVL
jgi:hypothetical protein